MLPTKTILPAARASAAEGGIREGVGIGWEAGDEGGDSFSLFAFVRSIGRGRFLSRSLSLSLARHRQDAFGLAIL